MVSDPLCRRRWWVFSPSQCCFSARFGHVLDFNMYFCSEPLAGAGARVGLLPWLFAARLSCMTPLAADLAESLLPTCGCGRGPGDVNLSTTFDGRRVVCV